MTPTDARRGARPIPACLAAAVLALSGCGAVDPGAVLVGAGEASRDVATTLVERTGRPATRDLSMTLDPAPRPRLALSAPVVAERPWDDDLRLEPRDLGGGLVEVRESDGCTWRRRDWFAPSLAWSGCGESAAWRDGTSTVTGGEGLWPLRLGAEGRFRRRAVSATGRSYERDTVCRVEDAVEVLRADRAPTPAFVVACDDGKRMRTTWWSPEEGPVAFRRRHADKGVEAFWIAR